MRDSCHVPNHQVCDFAEYVALKSFILQIFSISGITFLFWSTSNFDIIALTKCRLSSTDTSFRSFFHLLPLSAKNTIFKSKTINI